jgi:hypothetical protein
VHAAKAAHEDAGHPTDEVYAVHEGQWGQPYLTLKYVALSFDSYLGRCRLRNQ